jgi:hypothetical protein
MGQMTHGVLYGVKQNAPKKLGDDGWYALTDEHEPESGPTASGVHDEDGNEFLGFWVAVGASGKRDVPSLEASFRLDDIGGTDAYAESLAAAKAAWPAFVKWAETHAVKLREPALWMVETEVA